MAPSPAHTARLKGEGYEHYLVVQVVEEIITIPRVRRETREVIKEIPVERVVQRMVEGPRTERRVRQKPVTKEVEEIVELPKIRYIEEIVEVEVPFHKIEEVPEVIERLVPNFCHQARPQAM